MAIRCGITTLLSGSIKMLATPVDRLDVGEIMTNEPHNVRHTPRTVQLLAATATLALAAGLAGCGTSSTPQASAATTAPKPKPKTAPQKDNKAVKGDKQKEAETAPLVPEIDRDPNQIKPVGHSKFKLPLPQEKIDANSTEDPYFGDLSAKVAAQINEVHKLTNQCMKNKEQPYAELPEMDFPKIVELSPETANKTGYNSLRMYALQTIKTANEQAKKFEKKSVEDKINFYAALSGHYRGTLPKNASPVAGSCLGDAVIAVHGSISTYEQRTAKIMEVEKTIVEATFDTVRMRNKIARWQNCMNIKDYKNATPENNADYLVTTDGKVSADIKKRAVHDAHCRIHTDMIVGWNKSLAEVREKHKKDIMALEALYESNDQDLSKGLPDTPAGKPAAKPTKPAADPNQ